MLRPLFLLHEPANFYMTAPVPNKYRSDIDGLRAIAVLAVIFFHIRKDWISGGFAGVDIFFVISGFLISSHVLKEIELGQFSIVEFYRRRIKRIAMPLMLVIYLTLIAAQILMLPEDADRVASSSIFSIVSLANVYFWLFQDSSYFAADSSQIPLLHLWSLGIEEQFYIIWPLLLMWRFKRTTTKNLFFGMGVVALFSFVVGQLLFSQAPSFVYYMLPTRMGELLVGGIVALATLRGIENHIPNRAVLPMALMGLLLMGSSLFLLSESNTFPGLPAMFPTLGVALLILAGHCSQNRISKLLSFKPMVLIGLVSYSAYLWHWPLLALLRYLHIDIDFRLGMVVVVLTFLLSWLTYLFVERPARASTASATQVLWMQYLLPSIGIALIAWGTMSYDGLGLRQTAHGSMQLFTVSEDAKSLEHGVSNRIDPRLIRHDAKPRPAYEFEYVCQPDHLNTTDVQSKRCVQGAQLATPPQVILWGDSNAAHYVGVIGAIANQAGFNFRNIAVHSCPPIVSDPAPFVGAKRLDECRSATKLVREAIDVSAVVIISADWTTYDGRSPTHFMEQTFATVKQLVDAGKFVLIMGRAPIITGFEWECTEKSLKSPVQVECPFSVPPALSVQTVNAKLKTFAESTPHVAFYDVSPYLCKQGFCSAFDEEGFPLYFDAGHLSMPGSWKVGESIVRAEGVPAPFVQITEWLKTHPVKHCDPS